MPLQYFYFGAPTVHKYKQCRRKWVQTQQVLDQRRQTINRFTKVHSSNAHIRLADGVTRVYQRVTNAMLEQNVFAPCVFGTRQCRSRTTHYMFDHTYCYGQFHFKYTDLQWRLS